MLLGMSPRFNNVHDVSLAKPLAYDCSGTMHSTI